MALVAIAKQTACRARAEYRRSRHPYGIDRSSVLLWLAKVHEMTIPIAGRRGAGRANARASGASRSACEHRVSERRSMTLGAVVMARKSPPGRRDTGRYAVEGEGSTLLGHLGAKAGEGSAAEQYGIASARANRG
jgi:hypothetical protein